MQRNTGWRHVLLSSAVFFIIILSGPLAAGDDDSYRPVDFSKYRDKPIPSEIKLWLEGGEQSRLTPTITALASRVSGRNRRERLYNGIDFVWKNFKYDSWYNHRAFTRTADQLYQDRALGGCSDYALAHVTFLRALGVPARLVMTANIDWMLAYQKNDLLMPEGHVFIEAWLEDGWHLVDSTYRYIYQDYDLNNKSYPRREYFCYRAKDYWELGIAAVKDLNRLLGQKALVFKVEFYTDPKYPKKIIFELPRPD